MKSTTAYSPEKSGRLQGIQCNITMREKKEDSQVNREDKIKNYKSVMEQRKPVDILKERSEMVKSQTTIINLTATLGVCRSYV